MKDPKEVVRLGYDQISYRYRDDAGGVFESPYEDWLGTPMYWSHADGDTYITWVRERGFELTRRHFVPEGSGGHTLLLARRTTQ